MFILRRATTLAGMIALPASSLSLLGEPGCAGSCPDADDDGVCDVDDGCPGGDDTQDADGDGVPDACQDFVLTDGTGFTINGVAFHYVGANTYYLMTWAADPSLRPAVDEVLEEAVSSGVSVVRTWAFNDGDGWNALQTAPGEYDEQVFQGLDYVLARCDALGLRVVLPLVNSWSDYGGMDQYVAWSATAEYHDDFYTDPDTRRYYQDNAAVLVDRVNSVNGRRYGEDPTILAWELANEPRCTSDPSGDTLAAWIDEMSAYLKTIDPIHLVTTGLEGFYDDGIGPWYLDGSQGTDFVRDHAASSIDFATAHSWPDDWGLSYDQVMALLDRQIEDAAITLGKPFVLEEFGKARDDATVNARHVYDPATWCRPGSACGPVFGAAAAGDAAWPGGGLEGEDTTTRDLYYDSYLDAIYASASAGAHYWAAYHDTYPDYDGYGVYSPADSSTLAILQEHAALMAGLP